MRAVVRIALEAVQAVINAILSVVQAFCRLFGIAPPNIPQLPQPTTTPEDVRIEYQAAHTREVEDDLALAGDVGMAVFQYAAALDPAIRGAVDISGLSPAQADWLLGLKDEDLQHLVAAGPKACELAVSGKRCGIVGLPVPTAASRQVEGPHPVRNLLMDRVRASASRSQLVT